MSVSGKLGIKPGMRVYFDNAPPDLLESIDLPDLQILTVLQGEFDYIHLFVKTLDAFHERFPKLKLHLSTTGMLWLSWPKAGKSGTDLSLPRVIKAGYDYGLVESKTISINDTWSAIKFTHPKKGKTYHNSYGQLKSS